MITGKELVKYFSQNEENELDVLLQKAYSAGVEDGVDYAVREFSEKKKLSDYGSKRGYGRAVLVGGIPGVVGTVVGRKYADQEDEEGAPESKVITKAKRRGALVGGATGAGLGAIAGGVAGGVTKRALSRVFDGDEIGTEFINNTKLVPLGALVGASIGASRGFNGGYHGADKNTRARMKKRYEDK